MKKWLAIFSLITSAGVTGFLFGVHFEGDRTIPFNAQLWQLGSPAQTLGGNIEPFRHRMVSDLLKSQLVIGKTRAEVIELLGADGGEGDGRTYYWLNEEHACLLCIDPTATEQLVIEFDATNHARKAYVERS